MAEQEKTLEMRVAELEDKLSKIHITEEELKAFQKVSALLGGGAAPAAGAGSQVAAGCVVDCVPGCINECTIRPIVRHWPIVRPWPIRNPIIIRQCCECFECGGPGFGGGGFGGGGFGGLGG